MKTEKKETKVLENELTLRERIDLRKESYFLSLRIQPTDKYKSMAEWIDFKSRKNYHWLLTGKD